MADSISFEIEGVNSLNAKLEEVSSDVKFKGGRFALRKAAQMVAQHARENADRLDDPDTSNHIADNIAVRWSGKTFKNTGNLHFRVGVLGGSNSRQKNQSNPGGDTFYWRFLELGTEKMPAVPFLRPALADNLQPVTNEFVEQYSKAVDRALKRARKQNGGG